MIHRDVCPRNVLVSRSGHVRLADFGLVRPAFLRRTKEEQDVDERSLEWRTLKQSTIGASFYAPPDVVLDNKPHSRPADCWAVGCVLAEMVLPMVECAEAEARAAAEADAAQVERAALAAKVAEEQAAAKEAAATAQLQSAAKAEAAAWTKALRVARMTPQERAEAEDANKADRFKFGRGFGRS